MSKQLKTNKKIVNFTIPESQPEQKLTPNTNFSFSPNSFPKTQSDDGYSRSYRKKYPQTWKHFILPEIKQKQLFDFCNQYSGSLTTRSYMPTHKYPEFVTPQLDESSLKMRSRQVTRTSEAHQSDEKTTQLQKLSIKEKIYNNDRKIASSSRHAQWTGRIVLQNQYARQQADYIRQKFSNFLIHKYKPGAETLY